MTESKTVSPEKHFFPRSLDGNSLCNTIPGAACLLQTAAPSASLAHKASSGKKVMIILVLVGGLGAAAAALCACLFVVLRRKKSRVGTADEDEEKWMRFDILGKLSREERVRLYWNIVGQYDAITV